MTLWIVRSTGEFPRVECSREANRSAVAEVILSEVDNVDASTILLSTRRRTAFGSIFLGSVSRKVIRRAKCPVILVHSRLHRQGAARSSHTRKDPPDQHNLAA